VAILLGRYDRRLSRGRELHNPRWNAVHLEQLGDEPIGQNIVGPTEFLL